MELTAEKINLAEVDQGTSLWKDAFIRLRKNKLAMLGGIIVIAILILCFIVAPIMWAFEKDGNTQNLSAAFQGPSATHFFGTDQLGRDLFMRVLEGGQISLIVAILSTLLTVTIGIIYGGISGYLGGRIDATMMRIVDGLLAMPFLIIVILFRELIGGYVDEAAAWFVTTFSLEKQNVQRFANLVPLILSIAAFGWLTMARIVRSATASLTKQEFVEAARSLGLGHRRILFRHIVPNMLGPIIIFATLTIPSFILYEATLSFIGLGIEPPNSSWGILIKEGANFLETQIAILAIPAILFSLTLFAFNFLGDGLRDALDPKASKD